MPLYDVECPTHGITEVFRHMHGDPPLSCGICGGPAEQRHFPANAPHARIDDAENIGKERADPRVHGVNLGLPGRPVPLGKDASGRERYGYEPIRATEMGSNASMREYARTQGLTPADSGRYRSTR